MITPFKPLIKEERKDIMKIIKYGDSIKGQNSDNCKTLEYSFNDKDLDIGIAIINGRYPDSGYCANEISKELIYVLEGEGKIIFEDKIVVFEQGDAILIYPKEKYYWESNYCKVSMSCNPAWTEQQHRIY